MKKFYLLTLLSVSLLAPNALAETSVKPATKITATTQHKGMVKSLKREIPADINLKLQSPAPRKSASARTSTYSSHTWPTETSYECTFYDGTGTIYGGQVVTDKYQIKSANDQYKLYSIDAFKAKDADGYGSHIMPP